MVLCMSYSRFPKFIAQRLKQLQVQGKKISSIVITPRLFYVVVDSDETVSTLLTEMARRKEGRVTFMPLNRIRAQEQDYSRAPEAQPLIAQLQFDERYTRAFQQVSF